MTYSSKNAHFRGVGCDGVCVCVEAESERLLVCWVKSTPLFLLVCVQRPRERDRLVVDERSLEDQSIELHAPPSRDFLLAGKERERQCRVFAFFSPSVFTSIISVSTTAWARQGKREKYLRRGRDAGLFF